MAKRTEFTVNQADLQSPLFITNPLLGARAAVPEEVILRDGKILWRVNVNLITHGMFAFSEGDSVEGAMWEFVDLRNQPDEAFLDFAKRYGPLALKSNCAPATQPLTPADQPAGPDDTDVDWLPPRTEYEGKWWYVEEVSHWRMYVVGLTSFLAFATALKDDMATDPGEVLRRFELERYTDEFFGIVPRFSHRPTFIWMSLLSPWEMKSMMDRLGPAFSRQYIVHEMNQWIWYAGLSPIMVWEAGVPKMTLTLGGRGAMPNNMIFSVLVAQLAALVTSDQFDRVNQCSICGRMFLPTIKPGRHDRSFCPEHKIEGERERKRRWARKVAAERKAKHSG